MPNVRWYASECRTEEGSSVALKMTQDCLEYMAYSNCRDGHTSDDSEEEESEAADGDQHAQVVKKMLSVETDMSRYSARLLRSRTACVDVTDRSWNGIAWLQGS